MSEPRFTSLEDIQESSLQTGQEHFPVQYPVGPYQPQQLPAIHQPPPLPQVQLVFDEIRKYVAPPDATDDEVKAFILMAEHCNLDPIKREIYLAKINGKPVIMTGYQTYIQRAERTGVVLGWDCQPDSWENPTKATLIIHRRDWKIPFQWTTLREEVAFVHTKSGRYERATHKSQPAFQLMKCNIKQGFSLCFASELGGLPYIPEELPDADGTDYENAVPLGEAKSPAPLEDWKAAYFASIKDIPEFANDADRRQFQLAHTAKRSVADMDKEDMDKLFTALDEFFPEGPDGKRHARPQEPEEQSPEQPPPVPQSPEPEPPGEQDTVTLFNEVSQKFAEENGLDPKYLFLYLASRFLIPALDEQAEAFLSRIKTKKANIKALKDSVVAFTKWANTVGSDELIGCINDLHYYSSNLDEDAGAAFLKQFFQAFGIKPDRGLYKIWDIPPTAFGTWKFVVKSFADKFGFADEEEIDESEISDDEQIPEDVPLADDDIPFF